MLNDFMTISNYSDAVTGYLHPGYAESLAEFGRPRFLPGSQGWILERPIPNSPYRDAMGCYPLFTCLDWFQLENDLESLRDDLVSLAMVTDPLGEHNLSVLQGCFDVIIPFKEHTVVDLTRPFNEEISAHHKRNSRKGLQNVMVTICSEPFQFVEEWTHLYSALIKKHRIKGIAKFSPTAFAAQMKIPGVVMLRAMHKDGTVGITLWYVQNDVSYYHLAAYNELGYELKASFALFWVAIEYFAAQGLRWLNLGGSSGLAHNDASGLTRFKRGWSPYTRTAYFCGRIFDKAKYEELTGARNISRSKYFPAYRSGELSDEL